MCFATKASAQISCTFAVVDAADGNPLPGAVIEIPAITYVNATDDNGYLHVTQLPSGKFSLHCSMISYQPLDTIIQLQHGAGDTVVFSMYSALEHLEEVNISSTRTNARIEDDPTRIEVLGLEEMGEESTLVPTGIGSILGDLAIITIQRTSVSTGNDEIRMAGMDPRYTQMLRDGLPLYSGASGGLGALDIPPLDLQQVEVIKGSNSTLYGGGAIAGLINFVSRKPTKDLVIDGVLNMTSLLGSHASVFSGKQFEQLGYTCFAAATINQPVNVKSDNYSIIPQEQQFIVHPRIFYTLHESTKLDVGFQWNHDKLNSGFMDRAYHLQEGGYYAYNIADRFVEDITITHKWNAKSTLTFKSALSTFSRTQDVHTTDTLATPFFSLQEMNGYTELSNAFHWGSHTFLAGYNFLFEQFDPGNEGLQLSKTAQYTQGIFLQDDWHISEKFTCEIGLRGDVHSVYGSAVLPRIALFYKPAKDWSCRISGGSGYKTPNALDLSEPAKQLVTPVTSLHLERSEGVNADVNFHRLLNDHISLECNQALYYIMLQHPYALQTDDPENYVVVNDAGDVTSIGSDTYIRLEIDEIECYLGYNHTIAQKQQAINIYLPFYPHDKLSGVLAYDNDTWRMGIEASYQANQYLSDQTKAPDYLFMAAMISRSLGHFRLTLNGENLTNAIQQNLTDIPIVSGSLLEPTFSDIWAPIEGITINASLKYTF